MKEREIAERVEELRAIMRSTGKRQGCVVVERSDRTYYHDDGSTGSVTKFVVEATDHDALEYPTYRSEGRTPQAAFARVEDAITGDFGSGPEYDERRRARIEDGRR